MGNRAYMIVPSAKVAIYLHWNGGIESVSSFVDYANEAGIRIGDGQYCSARLVQIVANFFGGILSVGLEGYSGSTEQALRQFQGEDNGAYVIGESGGKLAILKWSRCPDSQLADRLRRTRFHSYNSDGGLMEDLRTKNDPFFKKDRAAA